MAVHWSFLISEAPEALPTLEKIRCSDGINILFFKENRQLL